ncbi:TPR10 [Auxenochlorella protothecoides x Auxenochlorella symbiontica]
MSGSDAGVQSASRTSFAAPFTFGAEAGAGERSNAFTSRPRLRVQRQGGEASSAIPAQTEQEPGFSFSTPGAGIAQRKSRPHSGNRSGGGGRAGPRTPLFPENSGGGFGLPGSAVSMAWSPYPAAEALADAVAAKLIFETPGARPTSAGHSDVASRSRPPWPTGVRIGEDPPPRWPGSDTAAAPSDAPSASPPDAAQPPALGEGGFVFGAAAQDARPARARKPKSPGSGKKPAPIASLGASNGTVTWEKILEAVADFDAASAEKEEAAHSVPTPSPPQSPSPTQPVSSVSAGPLPQPPSFLLRAARHASRSPPEDSAIMEARQAAEVAAERLRRAGNTAFGEHRWEDAREAYTQAIETLRPAEAFRAKLAPLLANRAAAWLSIGRPEEAVADCILGLKHDPSHVRCGIRLATCYMRMGEFPDALGALRDLEAAGCDPEDPAVQAKAAEVAEHAHEVLDLLTCVVRRPVPADLAARYLGERVSGESPRSVPTTAPPPPPAPRPPADALSLLRRLDAAHAAVPHSQLLLAARALCLLRRARWADARAAGGRSVHSPHPGRGSGATPAPWRFWVTAQADFHSGDLEGALGALGTLRGLARWDGDGIGSEGPGAASAALLRWLVPVPPDAEVDELRAGLSAVLAAKAEGNEHVAARRFDAAAEAYARALAAPTLSPAAAAVLHCNRAAAHLGAGRLALAVADSGRAACLKRGYAKAHSRLATALGEVGRHADAAEALRRALACRGATPAEKKGYQTRLAAAQRAAAPRSNGMMRRGGEGEAPPPPDHYRLLGLAANCSGEEVRRAFKRLALQLHPDKTAGAVRCRASLGSCGVVIEEDQETELRQSLQEAATWLFKCLSEAHEVLTDPAARRALDRELEGRSQTPVQHWQGGRPPFGPMGTAWTQHAQQGWRAEPWFHRQYEEEDDSFFFSSASSNWSSRWRKPGGF